MTLAANKQTVLRYLQRWKTLDKYVLQERCISRLFRNLCPENTSLVDVLLKVSALNDFYSTNIYDTHRVAGHIHRLNIDRKLLSGDLGLVDSIANVNFNGNRRRIYSFASKYCSHHSPEVFPIYDSFVDQVLWHFQKKDSFGKFRRYELKSFEKFVEAIDCFRKHYSLERFTRKEIDAFLWLAGKEHFPKSYQAP
jgi:hypothetical protein